MKVIKSASIACGFHAGDPLVMAKPWPLAQENGVSIGAHPVVPRHPGFRPPAHPDEREGDRGDGRLPDRRAAGIAAGAGQNVTHVKPHGALNNMACENLDIARCDRARDPFGRPRADPAGAGVVGADHRRARGRAGGGRGNLRRPSVHRRGQARAALASTGDGHGAEASVRQVMSILKAARWSRSTANDCLRRRQHLRAWRQHRGGGDCAGGTGGVAGRGLRAVGAAGDDRQRMNSFRKRVLPGDLSRPPA